MLILELFDSPITNTPAFQQWFAGSKAVDSNGHPLKLYHGTSKDADFKHFKMPKNGVWFTPDAKSASEYAIDNDSMTMRYDTGFSMKHVNTASRVIPVYLKMLNPKYFVDMNGITDMLPPNLRYADNYRRTQGIVFDQLRQEGYDSVIMGHEVYVMLDYNAPNKIKSAIGSQNFADNKKNIHETSASSRLVNLDAVRPGVLFMHPGREPRHPSVNHFGA
jgi:hypothetical protein